jgi:hypothetical protein
MPQVPHLLLEQLALFRLQCEVGPLEHLPQVIKLLLACLADNDIIIQLHQTGFISMDPENRFHQPQSLSGREHCLLLAAECRATCQ